MTTAPTSRYRLPAPAITAALLLSVMTLMLLATDTLCYRVTLPMRLTVTNGNGLLTVGSQEVNLGQIGQPSTWQFVYRDPVTHEYQLDDTDSTNNFTQDAGYLHTIADTPYYRFQSWMRDLDGTSVWRNFTISADGKPQTTLAEPVNGENVTLPTAQQTLALAADWQRPETPVTVNVTTTTGVLHITLDRNDRYIAVTRDQAGFPTTTLAHTFFPRDAAPFAAMVIDFIARAALWATILIWLVALGDMALSIAATETLARFPSLHPLSILRSGNGAKWRGGWGVRPRRVPQHPFSLRLAAFATRLRVLFARLTAAIHPLGLVMLAAAFIFTCWIALVQYHALPHIYDAGAYLFGAKIIASRQFSVPIPPAVDRFPGPFMVQHDGRWFTQYPPGTSLMLAIGVILHLPWLIEPLMGTLALLAMGLIAHRLFDRRIATLAVSLGALSPFYLYLAASYLSHAIALCFLAWGWYGVLRFAQSKAASGWLLPLSAASLGMAALTRDLVAVLFVALVVPGTLWATWRMQRGAWFRWLVPGFGFLVVALFFVWLYFGFNAAQTGDPFVTPRSLFFAGDRFGFGPGVGFYGEHTLAAGFVTVDELLTSLAIDLYGWPFYLTLAVALVPIFAGRAKRADWLMLLGAAVMTGAYVGFYYHGIYLGPRYLFETLPFWLILTARGIVCLAQLGASAGRIAIQWYTARFSRPSPALATLSPATIGLVALLLLANLAYFLPRQIALHQNFTGGPHGYVIDMAHIAQPPAHHAIVITSDFTLYDYTLFALNDPGLEVDVLYAYAVAPDQYEELRAAYPGRALYHLNIGPNGTVSYSLIP